MHACNLSELAALMQAGQRNEIVRSEGTTVIYSGTCPHDDPATADALPGWTIQKTIVVEDGDTTTTQQLWAVATEGLSLCWDNRHALTYKYR